MQKSKKRYILYGLIGVVILLAGYWGFNFLKGSSLLKKTNTYYVYYERIEGLNESSPVTVNGYKIGQVSKITFLPQNDCKLLIELEITNEFLLPDSTIARIYSMDLMGSKGVELVFSKNGKMHEPGDTLIGQIEQSLKDQVSIQMLPVKNQAEDLMKEIGNAIEIITYIFNEETRDNLEKSFASMKTTLSYIENSAYNLDNVLVEESGKISRILSNVESITLNLRNNHEEINNIISNLSDFSDTIVALDISKTIYDANQAIESFNNIIAKVEAGEGTLGQLLNDDKLAIELENAAENLDKLLKDLRYNPKKYVHFSLMNIGRTVNVTDEDELTERDRKALDRQDRKNQKTYDKNQRKEERKNSKKSNSSSDEDDESSSDDIGEISSEDILFMIQIRAATAPIELDSEELKGYTDVIEKKIGNKYKYFVYQHTDESYTSYYLEIVKEDFEDAFPTAFANEKQITYSYGVSLLASVSE